MYNPYIQGWINYYGNFYRTQLRPTLQRIDLYVIRWARRKFKRLRHQTKGGAGLVCAVALCKSKALCSLAAMSGEEVTRSRSAASFGARHW